MRHRPPGRTALQVSELCLGTMNFGPNISEADSFELLDRALDLGIDFVDTADQYGGTLGVGATETILGNRLAQGGERREQIVLHRPGVTAPIVGPRTMQQIDEAVHATTVVLTDQVLARLDEIFPGPGPAPEAYAW